MAGLCPWLQEIHLEDDVLAGQTWGHACQFFGMETSGSQHVQVQTDAGTDAGRPALRLIELFGITLLNSSLPSLHQLWH